MVRTVVNSCDGAVIGCSASIQLSDHHTCIWWIFTVNPMWNLLPLSLYHTLFHSISPMDKIFRYKNCHSDESDAIILKQEALHSLQIPWKKVPKGFIQNRFSLYIFPAFGLFANKSEHRTFSTVSTTKRENQWLKPFMWHFSRNSWSFFFGFYSLFRIEIKWDFSLLRIGVANQNLIYCLNVIRKECQIDRLPFK